MTLIAHLPRRDIVAILGALAGITLLSWWYISSMDLGMPAMPGAEVIPRQSWDASYFGMMFLMWAITMFVLLEKLLPFGDAGGRISGLALIAGGGVMFVVT